MKIKATLIASFFSISWFFAHAQEKPYYYGGAGHFFTGNIAMNFGNLNPTLRSSGFNKIPNSVFMTGGGGYGVIGSFMIGGEGAAFATSTTENAIGKASLSGAYGMVNFGYLLPIKSRFLFYPITGMGWGVSSLSMDYTIFQGLKENYSASTYYLKTEFNVDLFSNTKNNLKEKKGFKTGLSVGYLFNPRTSAWEGSNGQAFSNTFFNGFYLKLKVGGGGMELK